MKNMQNDLILGPKTDPRSYETIKCDHCGSIQFLNQYVLKKVSGLEVGNGAQSTVIPLNVLVCAKCGQIWSEDIKGYKLEEDLGMTPEKQNTSQETSEEKTGLIL